MEAFDYMRPTSVADACALLREAGGTARPLAGGTDILVQMREGKLRPAALVSLRDVPGLRSVRREQDGGLTIGAATRLIDVETSPDVLRDHAALVEAASWIGSVQVRDRATIGGNLCNAAPSADTAPILIAYGSSVTISDGRDERTLPLEDFFTGPGETVLEPGELLTAISVPPAPAHSHAKYYKTFRSAMDCCTVGVAVLVVFAPDSKVVEEARVVLGAIAPTPIRAPRCEEMLRGKELDSALMASVGALAAEEARPIDDVRASAEYRRVLAEVLTKRALAAADSWLQKGAGA
jgi:carbon-monoxide dehydrogenase medium subunit